MYNIEQTNDKTLIRNINLVIFGKEESDGKYIVLFENNRAVGVVKYEIDDSDMTIDRIGILKNYRHQGYSDFFIKMIICRFSDTGRRLVLKCVDGYFEKFGFVKDGETMVLEKRRYA